MLKLVSVALAFSLSLAAVSTASAQHARPSKAKENAEGDPNGAIRALGAAGYNDHGDRKPPAVVIPRLGGERPRGGRLPPGTR